MIKGGSNENSKKWVGLISKKKMQVEPQAAQTCQYIYGMSRRNSYKLK